MRPDFYDAVKAHLDRAFYVLKCDAGVGAYISEESTRDQYFWKYTTDLSRAMKFNDHTDAMLFVTVSTDCVSNFLGKKRMSIVRVAKVEVVTTTWKEV